MNPEIVRLHNEVRRLRLSRSFGEIHTILSAIPRHLLLSEADLHLALCSALSYLRRHAEAKQLLLQAKSNVLTSRNGNIIQRWQLLLAIQLIEDGDLRDAERLLLSSLSESERVGDHRLIADNNNSLGVISSFRGEVERALSYYNRSLMAWRKLGEKQGIGIAHYNMGLVLREWGRPHDAIPHFSHAQDYFENDGIDVERVYVGAERALLFGDLGDFGFAEQLARTAVSQSRGLAANGIKAAALRSLGVVLGQKDRIDEAKSTLLLALAILGEGTAGITRAEILEELSILYLKSGDIDLARLRFSAAAAEYLRIGSTNHCGRLHQRYEALQRESIA